MYRGQGLGARECREGLESPETTGVVQMVQGVQGCEGTLDLQSRVLAIGRMNFMEHLSMSSRFYTHKFSDIY